MESEVYPGVLILTSHAHVPPLRPASDLKYDLRRIPNPPKAIRSSHKGTSKRLREHMLGHTEFTRLLEQAEKEIRVCMEAKIAAARCRVEETTRNTPEAEGRKDNGDEGISLEAGEHSGSQSRTSLDSSQSGDSPAQDSDERDEEVPRLTVGAFCARGHHRSVAFIEELAAKPWPGEWLVRVVHRDINKSRPGPFRKDRGGRLQFSDEDDGSN
ncbi:hypothetical protein BX600DRAFT_440452 [Xylariales sp. PMI_506]|nr:hypothetical protein BX600DRAFT_440452 [Xylariales sp. PMI_506]